MIAFQTPISLPVTPIVGEINNKITIEPQNSTSDPEYHQLSIQARKRDLKSSNTQSLPSKLSNQSYQPKQLTSPTKQSNPTPQKQKSSDGKDAAAKRAQQNREAQRAFRERKEKYIQSLQVRVHEFEEHCALFQNIEARLYDSNIHIANLLREKDIWCQEREQWHKERNDLWNQVEMMRKDMAALRSENQRLRQITLDIWEKSARMTTKSENNHTNSMSMPSPTINYASPHIPSSHQLPDNKSSASDFTTEYIPYDSNNLVCPSSSASDPKSSPSETISNEDNTNKEFVYIPDFTIYQLANKRS